MNPEQIPDQQAPQAAPEPIQVAQTPPVAHIHSSKGHGSIEAITEPGEQVVFRTKKHPFGVVVMYLQAILATVLVGGLLYFLLPSMVDSDQQADVKTWIILGMAVFGMIMFLILLIVTYIYSQNELILTDRNVTQVIRNGLFSRQVSQLSLNNIEDVTADKEGVWAMLFNFGQVRIETAGEQNNFHFSYCPNPNHYGQLLLDTRAARAGGPNRPPH